MHLRHGTVLRPVAGSGAEDIMVVGTFSCLLREPPCSIMRLIIHGPAFFDVGLRRYRLLAYRRGEFGHLLELMVEPLRR